MRRGLPLVPLFFVLLASCGREVPLRIGPISLVTGLGQLEVRVWRDATCPGSEEAALALAMADPRAVAVSRSYQSISGAGAIGVVPSGTHAVSATARDTSCRAVAYGCTPAVDFASSSGVDIVWHEVSPPFVDCELGESCVAGACAFADAAAP